MGEQLARISLRATTSWASTDRACWSDRELCEIGRLREACEKFASLDWESGHSDEGDPWCIAHDQDANRSSCILRGLIAAMLLRASALLEYGGLLICPLL